MNAIRIAVAMGFIALPCASPVLGTETAPQADPNDRQVRILKTTTGVEFGLLGEKPAAPGVTLFSFGADLGSGIHALSRQKILPFLVEQGYVIVSLDAPETGRNCGPAKGKEVVGRPKGDEVLDAWRYRIDAKENFIPEFNQKISKVLDYLIAEGYTDLDRVAALGGSMGAFIAFHYAVSDPRVRCVAGQIPLTDLRVLTEFKGMENDPLTKSLDARNLAEKFAGHNLLVIVGKEDRRISTDHAIAFAQRVSNVAEGANVELHVLDGGHSLFIKGLGKLTEEWLTRHFPSKALK